MSAPGNTQTAVPADRQLALLQDYSNDPASVSAGLTGAGGVKVSEEAQEGQTRDLPEGGSTPNIPGQPEYPGQEIHPRNIQTATGKVPLWVARLPSPGTILFPLLVVIFFWVMIEKTNGKSRWEWLWGVATGSANVATSAFINSATGTGKVGGTLGGTTNEDPALLRAFSPSSNTPVAADDLPNASTYQPTFSFTPSSKIAVTD